MNYFRILLALGILLGAFPLVAQRIILDRPTKAGELTLFPEVGDTNSFYYVSDKARLATDEDGRPKFSFLRYVTNTEARGGEQGITQGEGGGILHAVVSLGVTDEQRQEAERELRSLYPEGELVGPVIFKSGTFGLVTSFTDENGELSKSVVGTGMAPILDGQEAAVSFHLTRLGATLLWESFRTATPDISFTFQMTMDGYRLPKQAVIEADFEDIYESHEFAAGLNFSVGGGDDEEEDEDASDRGNRSDDAEDEAESPAAPEVNENEGSGEEPEPEEEEESPEEPSPEPSSGEQDPNPARTEEDPASSPSETHEPDPAGSEQEEEGQQANSIETRGERSGPPPAAAPPPTGSSATDAGFVFGVDIHAKFEKLRKDGVIKITQIGSDEDMEALINTAYSKLADMMFDRVETAANDQASPTQLLSSLQSSAGSSQANRGTPPVNGLTFSYKFKKKRRTGTFRMDLNKWTTDELVMRFDENIGNLSRHMNDTRHFHQINTDEELYRQREIYPILDGYNAADFGEYINFVAVRLKKVHEGGAITEREVKIDRHNFNNPGSNFAMTYGWKEDSDREDWMHYQYEVLWSFFGGVEHHEPMTETAFSAINLAPPYRKQEIEFQADPDLLDDQEIRIVTVDIFYQVGDQEFTKQVVLNPARDLLSQRTEYLTTEDNPGYQYRITWRLRGNRTVQTELLSSNDTLMFVDELPLPE